MAKLLTARLDDETEKVLAGLARASGKTESQLVRDGIHLIALSLRGARKAGPEFVGLGKFESGKTDLGSSKKRLAGFGK